MPTLGDLLQKTLDREAIEQMGQRVDADERTTRRGVVASAAVLAEAMKNNARRRGGDRALYEAIEARNKPAISILFLRMMVISWLRVPPGLYRCLDESRSSWITVGRPSDGIPCNFRAKIINCMINRSFHC